MASILKRTIYADNTGGFLRFMDWANVITPLGRMVEPFLNIGGRVVTGKGFDAIDFTDEMSRIDEIILVDEGRYKLHLSDDQLHGGNLLPRVGK